MRKKLACTANKQLSSLADVRCTARGHAGCGLRRGRLQSTAAFVAEEDPSAAKDALPGEVPEFGENTVLEKAVAIDATELTPLAHGADFFDHCFMYS